MERTFELRDGRRCLLRPLREEDLPQVLANVDSVAAEKVHIASEGIRDPESFRNQLIARTRAGDWIYLVAELDGRIVGDLNLQLGTPSKRRHTAYVGMLLVDGFRGLGIGRALMDLAVRIAGEKAVEKLYLSAFSTNERALEFYRRCGFEVEAVLKKQFLIDGRYVDEVYMARWLR